MRFFLLEMNFFKVKANLIIYSLKGKKLQFTGSGFFSNHCQINWMSSDLLQ